MRCNVVKAGLTDMRGYVNKMLKENLKRIFASFLVFTVIFVTYVYGPACFVQAEDSLKSITATDALGRTMPDVSGYKNDKFVGVFYFLWHGQHRADKVRNITELLKTNYDDLFDPSPKNKVVPYDSWLHYNEPLYGYYNSMDEWVMRKHIEMFIACGVDFVAMDFTNGVYYNRPLMTFLNLLIEYKDAGWNIPKVMFYINVDAQNLTQRVYKNLYNNDTYSDLFFYGNSDKPIIVSVPDALDETLNSFFDVRASQWNIDKYGDRTWPYWRFTRDWHIYTDMVSVSLAQTGTAFSFAFEGYNGEKKEAWGRGYSTKNPFNGDVEAILRGDNFQEGFDAAIKLDPDYIFITGWNEWVVQKMNLHTKFPDLFPENFPDFTDNFNVEFSRDIEMTKDASYVIAEDGSYLKEGYGDNCFLQLAANIRRFKGIAKDETTFRVPASVSIDINGSDSQWDNVQSTYTSVSVTKTARDADGFYIGTHYTQNKPENFIKQVKVTYDDDNIYLRIMTEENISEHQQGKTNWMNLFIGIENAGKPAWQTFNYVINRLNISDSKTSIERFISNGSYETELAGELDYRVSGNVMLLAVPYSILGIRSKEFSIVFKVADSIEKESDILDYYVSGDSFPLGRMAYSFETVYMEGIDPNEPYEIRVPKSADNEADSENNIKTIIAVGVIVGVLTVGGILLILKVKSRKK